MATLTIRNLDDSVRDYLRKRAAENGRSMEAEVRAILEDVKQRTERSPAEVMERIRQHFAAIGGVELEIPEREPAREPPNFEDI